jgi:hypothetical protein
MLTIPDNISLVKTYFLNGTQPKGWKHQFVIQNPPTFGYSHAIVIRGEKRSTILCPFTLQSYQVPNSCGEMSIAVAVPVMPLRLVNLLTASWHEASKLGLQRDFAVAAMVLTEMGAAVPKMSARETSEFSLDGASAEPKTQGGKPIVHANLRPVRPSSKRGEVARFFSSPVPQSLHEAMARLGLTRSGVLSHLFCLSRDHGVGYTLANDCATLLVPDGFDLFAYVEPEKKAPTVPVDADGQPREVKKRTSGKPINLEALTPIPQPGKRAAIAEIFVGGFYSIESAMGHTGLNRSAILSHLFTINKENGLGYELSEDGTQARLLIPEGHEVFCAKQSRAKKEAA